MSPTSPREGERPRVDQPSDRPPASENRSNTVSETELEQRKDKASTQTDVSLFPPLFDEISLLQERLSYLEGQAALQWQATVEDAPAEDSEHGRKPRNVDSDDDKVLRKHIRKAPSGRRWVQMTEKRGEDTTEDRKEYGQEPNRNSRGRARMTMYHVQKNGDLWPGSEADALLDEGGWLATHGPPFPELGLSEETVIRQEAKPFPHSGVRPPTSMQPFYETPVRRGKKFEAHPPRLSRKLGPPSKWDESDSEEWSSDTSTRSQDFKYFRARLRGDFEWELDRLNAQVMRYKKHQDKKKSRELAIQAQKDKESMKQELESYDQNGDFSIRLEHDSVATGKDKHRVHRVNPLGWFDFLRRRVLPLKFSSVIDVLVEEPKVSSNLKPWRQAKRENKDNRINGESHIFRAPAAADVNNASEAGQSFKQYTPWMEKEPMPERIRINSKEIIDVLSTIHGSPLCLDSTESSVVLLRPFRILNAYDKEIREIISGLELKDAIEEPDPSISVKHEGAKEHTDSTMTTNDGDVGNLLDIKSQCKDEAKEEPYKREEGSVQLEHLNCLREFMDEYMGRKVAYLNSESCSKITFSDVWYLFQPGTSVIAADGKQAFRVVSIQSKRHKGADRWAAFWGRHDEKKKKRRTTSSSDESADDTRADITIKCVFIHFDGELFGPVIQTFHVNKWDGEKEVTYLDVYPLRFHVFKHLDKRAGPSTTKLTTKEREQQVMQGVQALRQQLIDRGRVFLDVASVKQMYYSGLAVDTRDEIESQVMVDFEEALSHTERKHWIPKIRRLLGTDWGSKTDDADEGCTAECCWHENVHDDTYVEAHNTERFIDDMMAEIKDTPQKLPSAIIFPRSLEETKSGTNALTDDELMIMSYTVFGFVLRDRTWGKFSFLFSNASIKKKANMYSKLRS